MPLIQVLLMVAILAVIVVVANLAEKRLFLRSPLYLSLVAVNLLFVAYFLWLAASDEQLGEANRLPVAIITLVFGVAAMAMLFEPVRRRLAPIFPRPQLTGAGFDPASMVHMTAMIYCNYFLGFTVLSYAIAGGLAGLAEEFKSPSAGQELAQLALLIAFPVLGVGLGIRRDLRGTIRRLGLRAPTLAELGAAATAAFLLFVAEFMIANVWEALTPENVIREQTQLSEQIGSSIGTLSAGLLIAGSAALGEEIAFRGALQPIFGLWPTAIFFALVHIQYTLTPATLIIVVVGLGFGWLRQRYNTTAAIVAHFLYDFGLIALALYVRLIPLGGHL